MSTASIAVTSQFNNHELDKIVQKTTELLKLEAVQAMNSQMNHNAYKFKPGEIKVGGKKVKSYPSVGSVVAERFNNLDPAIRRTVRLDLGRDESITHGIRRYGIDMRSSKSVTDQIDKKAHFNFINDRTFSKTATNNMVSGFSEVMRPIVPVSPRVALESDLHMVNTRFGHFLPGTWISDLLNTWSDPGTTAVLNKGLKFRVHEVKCIDETNPEWPGHDEIAWGGAAIDHKDTTTKIPEYYVGGGFDDGDKKRYTPPKIVMPFDTAGGQYPKTFFVTLALAEKDHGGMSKFITELYKAIKAHLQKILTALGAAAGAWIGAKIGGSVGTAIGGPLGTVIGVVAGAILGALIGWLIAALKDDIFKPQGSSVILTSGSDTVDGGSLVSAPMYFHYRDHGGHYRVRYDWEIVR